MTSNLADAASLFRFVESKDDRALCAAALQLGVSDLLADVLAGLCRRYRPDASRQDDVLLKWSLSTPEGPRLHHLRVTRAGCTAISGTPSEPASVELEATLENFLRVVSGQVNALTALSRGQLNASGEPALAVRQQLWFVPDLSHAVLDVSSPAELARLLGERSDGEINAGVAVAGMERTLRGVFDGMVDHYLPAKGPGDRVIVEFLVQTELGPRPHEFIAHPGGAEWHARGSEAAQVGLELGLPDLLRLVCGKLDGLTALAQGRLQVRGNMWLASGLQEWFDMS
jgi:putative sterol carrier protein